MKYKYCLIVSQMYYSYHCLMVKIPDNYKEYLEKFRYLIKELEAYKGGESDKKDLYLGDFEPKYVGNEIRYRYNLNSCHGDLYFINSNKVENLLFDVTGYKKREFELIKSWGKRKINKIEPELEKRHEYKKIKEIIEKYFELI